MRKSCTFYFLVVDTLESLAFHYHIDVVACEFTSCDSWHSFFDQLLVYKVV